MPAGWKTISVRSTEHKRDKTGRALPPRRARKRFLRVGVAQFFLLCAMAAPAAADEMFYNPRTTYGETGILDMPSARTAPEGEIAFTVSALQGTQHYNASIQILPWLEASFRYSHIIKLFDVPPLTTGLYDRSFGMKIRLFQETRNLPELSLGFRDILGTGIYAGEYLVATKRFYDDYDVSLGVGWGRFAQSNALPNPFASIFSSFKTRNATNPTTGVVDFGEFFHGPKIGVFGGAIWHTPIDDLNVLVEYSSDRYDLERQFGVLKEKSPVNLGLSYRLYDSVVFSAGWYYGASFGATVTVAADPTTALAPLRLGPDVPDAVIRTPQEQARSLELLVARNAPVKPGFAANAPWVNIADSSGKSDLELVGALLSEGAGVRNAEKDGHTLVIEATLTHAAHAQCDSYAQIAAGLDQVLDTVAVSDLDDPSGKVVFCGINRPASLIVADGAAPSQAPAPRDPAAVRAKIIADIDGQDIRTEALSVEGDMLWLYFSNGKYGNESEAVGRVARVLMADAPPDVEIFHLVSVKRGLPMREFQIARSALERAATTYATVAELGDAVYSRPPALANPLLDRAEADTYPRLHWALGPGLREGLFDPDRPVQIQLYAAADASVDFTPRITLEGRVEANIYNNYNFNRLSDSLLPHVRSDASLYVQKGGNGVADLRLSYHDRIAPDVYVEARAGYLEDMFAGGGVQVLWRPEGERFAIGMDAYEVWQRNFDRLFGVQDYHVLTGHVSLYYASPWYGLNFNVHAGRYLAGDYGATFEITRRFQTGVEIGAFATFTNVPFAKFGEGSFDKGIIIHIPFEWALPIFSQSSYDLLLRSLTRDGGQRLEEDDSLYNETRPTSFGEFTNHADNVTAP